MEFNSGILPLPVKMVIYGPEGIGKSSFAAKAPNPIFIDTEKSTVRLNIMRILPFPENWEEIWSYVERFKRQSPYKTLVIDTADWAEQMLAKWICKCNGGKKSIEDFGFGRGYNLLGEEFGNFLHLLTQVVNTGMHVIVICHSKMRKFEQPDEIGAYDRWELKLSRQVAPLLKEWAEIILFANYKTYVVDNGNGSNKVQGGKRVMYATHHPCWDAKNRFNLPDEMPFDFDAIQHIFTSVTPSNQAEMMELSNEFQDLDDAPEIPGKLAELMKKDNVTLSEIELAVTLRNHYPAGTPFKEYSQEFVTNVLINAWPQVRQNILEQRISKN